MPGPSARQGSAPPPLAGSTDGDDEAGSHPHPTANDPMTGEADSGSNLGESMEDDAEVAGDSSDSGGIPASHVPPSQDISNISETQQSLGISPLPSDTSQESKSNGKPGPKSKQKNAATDKASKIPIVALTRTRNNSKRL